MFILSILLGGCDVVDVLNPFDPPDEDEVDPGDTGPEPQGDAPGAGFPFADDQVFEIALTLPPTSVDALVYEGDYVPATFGFAGFEADAGVRLKGAGTFDTLAGKPSLKVHFGAFTPDGRFFGHERLTLNAMKFDRSKMREAVAYRVYAQMEVPAPRHGYAHLTINGENYGLYSIVETLDENFLKRAYPGDDDGYLYDSTFVYADLTTLGLPNFDLQEGDAATAYTDLQSLVGQLETGNFWDVFQNNFDVDATLAFLAVDLASPNWDGYSRNTNNFLLYHATVANRWTIVPWGQDSAFYGGGLLYGGMRARITTGCQTDPTCGPLLEARVRDVLTVWEEQDLYGWAATTSELIDPTCQADQRKQEDCRQDEMLELLLDRPETLRRELGL